MRDAELTQYDNARVEVTLTDGTVIRGIWDVTPERGLYHVHADAQPVEPGQGPGLMGLLDDIRAADVESIRRL